MSEAAPDQVDALIKAGRTAMRGRKFDEAAALLERAISENPDSYKARELRATIAFAAKDFEQAAAQFREASRCDARRAEPLINLGAVLNKLKDFKGALESLQRSLQRSRSNPETYYNLGLAYRGLGQAGMAVSAYKEAIRLKPEFAEAHQNLGNAYLDQKNIRQAVTSFNRALELNPELRGAQRGLQKANAARAGTVPVTHVASAASGITAAPIAMTEIQRAADREIVNEATKRIERNVLAWLSEIRSQLEPSTTALSRAIVGGAVGEGEAKLSNRLTVSVHDCDDLDRLLREGRLLLEEHEQDIREL